VADNSLRREGFAVADFVKNNLVPHTGTGNDQVVYQHRVVQNVVVMRSDEAGCNVHWQAIGTVVLQAADIPGLERGRHEVDSGNPYRVELEETVHNAAPLADPSSTVMITINAR
jgi:hypothetical protein